ncbi:peroxisomal trans-2-enoyl-CoA reductase [Sarotherodon galilaeus]
MLRRNHLEKKLLVAFHRSTIESVLTDCITVWYANCSLADKKNLQRFIKRAQKLIGRPSLEDIASTLCHRTAKKIANSSHPRQHLFNLMRFGYFQHSIR